MAGQAAIAGRDLASDAVMQSKHRDGGSDDARRRCLIAANTPRRLVPLLPPSHAVSVCAAPTAIAARVAGISPPPPLHKRA
jgi:hypothetical protein